MALKFISDKSFPTYLAVSGDIVEGAITGASMIGKTVYLTDTGTWKIIKPDLTLGTFTFAEISSSNFGDASNYTTFASNGHQTMVGTAMVWEDLRVEPSVRGTGSNNPSFEKWYDNVANNSRGVFLYSFTDVDANNEKEIFFTMQMPHAWAGTSIYVHVHWVGSLSDTVATPRWGLEYIWSDIGSTFVDTTTIYTVSKYPTDADITAGKHYIHYFDAIAPSASQDGLSSILIGRLFRNSSDGADTYNIADNKCGLLYIDAHYEINSLGSNQEYIK